LQSYATVCFAKDGHAGVDTDRKLFLNQRLCIVRTFIFPRFQNMVMKNDLFLDLIYIKSTGTANQANIGMSAINEWVLPLPPLSEQRQIIAKVDELYALCDALKVRIDVSKEIKIKLADSMVENALKDKPAGKVIYPVNEQLSLAAEPGL
jgi:type I restriction enzyme S subunit